MPTIQVKLPPVLVLTPTHFLQSGRTAIDRLTHIVHVCPTIAPEAYHLALLQIQQSRDPLLYVALNSAYDQMVSDSEIQMPRPSAIARIDGRWLDEVNARNQAERTKLEVELKTYTNNMIKESIRVRISLSSIEPGCNEALPRWLIAISATFIEPQEIMLLPSSISRNLGNSVRQASIS